MSTVLICDDEQDIVNALKIYLGGEGYDLLSAENGQQVLELLAARQVDLLLLDIMMPGMDGIATLSTLRRQYNLPVILLTAKSEDTDKILGLNMGADDYITKPFNPVEVLARVRSALRRYTQLGALPAKPEKCLAVGGIMLDDRSKTVTLDGEPVALTPTEYDILYLLMQHVGEVLSPTEIYRAVWNTNPIGAEGTIAVHIRHLREKIEINPAEPRYLRVVWGKGYRLESDKVEG